MIEVPTLLFILISEGFVVLFMLLLAWSLLAIKRRKKDKLAVKKLVDQIKQQSATRLELTGSFLNEKYRFEGDELKKAVQTIDKAEKKFIQNFINVYINRDADGLSSMDAVLAELIDHYKSLSPIMPDAETMAAIEAAGAGQKDEIEELRTTNEKLSEELSITKETMSNMIAEFGNMFGGGAEHELAKHEVIEKVAKTQSNDESESDDTGQTSVSPETNPAVPSEQAALEKNQENDTPESVPTPPPVEDNEIGVPSTGTSEQPKNPQDKQKANGQIVTDEDIDDLLDGFDLSEHD